MSRSPWHALLFTALTLAGCATPSPRQADNSSGATQVFAACETQHEITAPNPKYPWTPKAIRLTSQKLAPGVFAVYDSEAEAHEAAGIPAATSGGFVIGDEGVLLVESMINRQLFCQFIRLVRQETDKPIRYVVNTSHHGDHSYGNFFLPQGVHVVQHERTAAFIAHHFAEDVAFMTGAFGADQGFDEIRPVAADILVKDSGWSVDLGNVTVEARYQGFGQTEGDLFVWVPSAKVLWTGNPLIAQPPAIPWLLDGHAHEVRQTLAAVQASLPSDAIVVPGHGRPSNPQLFDFSIRYLDALQSQVRVAVDHHRSLEQTVSDVSLKDFQGYALWGWIHTQVNVPKTYAEASRPSP
ncbi:MBL fold metallo-hydrolase [Hyalangium versicolor]|uniref:MBL fold metallo-hydrolase n=1 Tax=Hyalangium versicolor TaxID=2861190 RepID=UPI001CC993D0|nr:MBL fold metallo-hydrolase [Hyalangium versicolor]